MVIEVNTTNIVNHLVQQFGVEQGEIEVMLPTFYKAILEYQDDLVTSIEGEEIEVIARAAHKLKGALLNLGLFTCAEFALSIERSAKLGDADFDYEGLADCLSLHLAGLREKI